MGIPQPTHVLTTIILIIVGVMISKVFLQLIEYLDWKTFEYGATDRRSSGISELGTKLNADIFPITFPGQHIVLFVHRVIWGKKKSHAYHTHSRERGKKAGFFQGKTFFGISSPHLNLAGGGYFCIINYKAAFFEWNQRPKTDVASICAHMHMRANIANTLW